MAPQLQRKALAVDTNLLLDLAEGFDFAHSFLETFQRNGYSIFVPPTVLIELNFLSEQEASARKRQLASVAFENFLDPWGLTPLTLRPVDHSFTGHFSDKLIKRGFLPEGEVNDGEILAETSLANLKVLATSDGHILGIPHDYLETLFKECDLTPVYPSHPRDLTKVFYPKRR